MSLGKAPVLSSTCHETDHQRIAFFERHHFTQRPNSIVHMMCLLDAAIQVPDIPDGWTIRSVLGESEAAVIVALHRAAFGTQYMTKQRRLQMMRTHWYDPRLNLVAVAPDGTLAATG